MAANAILSISVHKSKTEAILASMHVNCYGVWKRTCSNEDGTSYFQFTIFYSEMHFAELASLKDALLYIAERES